LSARALVASKMTCAGDGMPQRAMTSSRTPSSPVQMMGAG
jgi:hypothetical protein